MRLKDLLTTFSPKEKIHVLPLLDNYFNQAKKSFSIEALNSAFIVKNKEVFFTNLKAMDSVSDPSIYMNNNMSESNTET